MISYCNYKDSGAPWLGAVPAHWRLERAKWHFSVRNERGNSEPLLLAATQKNGMYPQEKVDGVVKVADGTDIQQFKTVHKSDFVISLRSFQGGFERSDYEGVCSPAYQVFFADQTIWNNDYLKFLFKDVHFIDAMNALTVGIREGRNIKYEDFANSLIAIPPRTEQTAIAEYLLARAQEIDEIISEAKASIEEYKTWKASIIYEAVTKGLDPSAKMKDSGVPWIGLIPAQWGTCSLKRLTTKIGSGKTPLGGAEVYTTEGILFLRSQNIFNTGLEVESAFYISEEINSTMENSQVQYQDVLLNITGGSIGRCCIYDLNGIRANVNQHVCILRTIKTKLLPGYLRYFWISSAGPMVVEQYQTGGNRPGLNFEQIGATKIPYCDIETQQQIVEYLDCKCEEIDTLVEEKTSLIQDLESYKKSLIFEVVTGKRRVC